MKRILWVSLGRVRYHKALEIQRKLHSLRGKGEIPDTVLSLEHEPVITLGRSADPRHILADPAYLVAKGVDLVEAERGGDVTYHGPGQLVLYPILDLRGWKRSVKWYIWALEEVMIRVASSFGIAAGRLPGYPGIWASDRKLGSVGVYVRSWITMHGLALNVDLDPDGFEFIVPCGIHWAKATSLSSLLGRPVGLGEAESRAQEAFAGVFEAHPVEGGLPEAVAA